LILLTVKMIKKIYKKFHQTDCPLASLRAPPDASSPASAMQSTATALHSCAVSFAKSRSAGRRRPVARCCRQAPRRPAGPYVQYSNAPSGRPARVRALCSQLCSALALAAHRRAAADGRRSGSALPSALHLTAPARPARRRRRRVPSRIGRRGASVGSRRVGLPQRRVARVPSRRASSLLRPPPTATGGFPRARARARPSWGPGGQRLGEARGGRRRRR
jgi:hypothetical protein